MVVLLLAAGVALAAEAPFLQWDASGEPIEIDAQAMELHGRDSKVLFTGSVVATRGDMTLQADKLEVLVDEQGKQIRSVEATGNVRVRKGEMVASGQNGSYDVEGGVVTLTGDPKVWRGRDAVGGETIILHLADERIVVENARAVLFPEAEPTPQPEVQQPAPTQDDKP